MRLNRYIGTLFAPAASFRPSVVKGRHLKSRQKRVGIYAGAFNPVHAGHIGFALQALQAAQLDRIYYMPERQPRHKAGAEHYGHRVAMVRRALQPHPDLHVLETDDIAFTVGRTLPRLQRRFAGAQLVFLLGSDVAAGLAAWPNIENLLAEAELVIGLRNFSTQPQIADKLAGLPTLPKALHYLQSFAPNVSSGQVRAALQRRQPAAGLLRSVEQYSNRHWLYVSLT